MRLAYVCLDPGVPVFGRKGCSIHVQEVIRSLQRRDIEVDLYATRIGGEAPVELEELRVHQLPKLPKGDPALREEAAMAINPVLEKLLEDDGPYDLVYERHALWSSSAMEYAHKQGIPGLLEVNAPLIDEQQKYRDLIHVEEAQIFADRSFQNASAMMAVSDGVATWLKNRPAARGRVHVIANGVNTSRFDDLCLERTEDAGDHHFTVGFVGTLKPWHGVDILVDAFARFLMNAPESKLLIVGDGPEWDHIQTKLAGLDIAGHTTLTGAVHAEEIPSLIRKMDVTTAPYPHLEDFYFSPLKIFEYMAAGKAVIASAIGQIPSLIEDGETGVLCNPGCIDELAGALLQLHNNQTLRQQLGNNARIVAQRDYTWDAVVGRILELAHLKPMIGSRKVS